MLGRRLKQERERIGLTQPQFGAAVGAKKNTIIDWQNGLSSPTARQLIAMLAIGVDVPYLLSGERSPPGWLHNAQTAAAATESASMSDDSRVALRDQFAEGWLRPPRLAAAEPGSRYLVGAPLRADQFDLLTAYEHSTAEVRRAVLLLLRSALQRAAHNEEV